jgi:hypothetical protein
MLYFLPLKFAMQKLNFFINNLQTESFVVISWMRYHDTAGGCLEQTVVIEFLGMKICR